MVNFGRDFKKCQAVLIIGLVVWILLAVSNVMRDEESKEPVKAAELIINGKISYQVKLAQTDDELQKGLMFVKYLPENAGMLFDLRAYQHKEMAFWMKNTFIPLDMVFFDCAFRIVDIFPNAQPHSVEKITSLQPFCYVLEINGGESLKEQLAVGQQAVVIPSP